MRTVDTNILVRAFTDDDPAASALARAFLSEPEPLHIPIVVLCEFVWTLRSSYRLSKADLAEAIRGLIEVAHIRIDRESAGAGLAMLVGGGDFADGVVLHEARRAGSRQVVTFDRKFSRLGAPEVALLS